MAILSLKPTTTKAIRRVPPTPISPSLGISRLSDVSISVDFFSERSTRRARELAPVMPVPRPELDKPARAHGTDLDGTDKVPPFPEEVEGRK